MAKGETTTITGQHPLPVGPCAVVIFGASGDLTKRKLVPALYNLAQQRLLPDSFAIVGVATSELGTDAFRERLDREARDHVGQGLDAETLSWLLSRVTYLPGNFRDAETYQRLVTVLGQVDAERGTGGNFVFYLATPPAFFGEIVERLAGVGLAEEDARRFRRIVVEKPFGTDLDSARALNRQLCDSVNEEQIYRIDHYLGKETVQNILVFRFANGIFEPIWNRRYVDHVQITVAEDAGRGGAREVLRGGRRAARHVSQPPVPAPRPDRHGAAHLLRARLGARREGQGPGSHQTHNERGGPLLDGAGAVR